MSVVPLSEILDDRTILFPITVEQYHQMIESGIIEEGEPYELLEGHVIRKDRSSSGEDPMTVSRTHVLVVLRLGALDRKFEPLGCHLQTQQPITLPSLSEPEPDAAVVQGSPDDYTAHPGAADLHCVIEVADASLRRDRKLKQRIYAQAGIPQYVIINLVERVAEVFTEPRPAEGRYAARLPVSIGETLNLSAGNGRSIPVSLADLLA